MYTHWLYVYYKDDDENYYYYYYYIFSSPFFDHVHVLERIARGALSHFYVIVCQFLRLAFTMNVPYMRLCMCVHVCNLFQNGYLTHSNRFARSAQDGMYLWWTLRWNVFHTLNVPLSNDHFKYFSKHLYLISSYNIGICSLISGE